MSSANSSEQKQILFEKLGIVSPENELRELNYEALNHYLGALFFLRQTLPEFWKNSPDYLAAFDNILTSALMIAVSRRGIGTTMSDAQRYGWVDNGVDI